MSDAPDHPPQDQFPAPLRNALAEIYARQIPIPAEIDEMILSSARAGYARRRRAWAWTGRIGIAAAAALLAVAIRVAVPHASSHSGPALQARAVRGDVNGDGRIDILDAFSLARTLHNGGKLDPAWDVNGDGKIDEKDVDWLARRAVRVEGGTVQ